MGVPYIETFLTDLAVNHNIAAATQNQALSALIFLYREVLHIELSGAIDAIRAKKPKRLPTVLTKDEVRRVIDRLSQEHQLMAKLLYGSGLRLLECLRLRVKDLDFEQRSVISMKASCKSGQNRRAASWNSQTYRLPHLPPQFCHTPPGKWL